MLRKIGLLSLLILPLLYFNCGKFAPREGSEKSDDPGTVVGEDGAPLTAAEIQTRAKNILQTNCNSCHSTTVASVGLGDTTNVTNLLSGGLVVPGEDNNSILYQRVAANQMPPAPATLSDFDKRVIRAWIYLG